MLLPHAQTLAKIVIPNGALSFQDEKLKHLSPKVLKDLDTNADNKLSISELTQAFHQDQIDFDFSKQQLITRSQTENPSPLFPVDSSEPVNLRHFEARYHLPTRGEIPKAKTPSTISINWQKPLSEVTTDMGSGQDLIENVSKLMNDMDYEANSNKDNFVRRPVEEVWKDLNADGLPHGECSDIHNIGTYILNQNGIDAYSVQMFRAKGPHNVTIYQDPTTGKYNILEYGKMYTTNADSPEDAMRKFQNDAVGTIYKYVLYKPTNDGKDFQVRSIGKGREAALLDKWTESPNMDWGIEGLPNGIRLNMEQMDGKVQNMRLGYVHTNAEGRTVSADLSHDKISGMTVGKFGMHWDRYNWFSTGVVYHEPTMNNPFSKELEDMPTLLPFFGGSVGADIKLAENDALKVSLNPYLKGRLAPAFVMTEEGRKVTEKAQNGNAAVFDAGQAVGFSDLTPGADVNISFKPWEVGEGSLKLDVGVRSRYDLLADPTMIVKAPTAFWTNTADASLKYQQDIGKGVTLSASVGGQVTDSLWQGEQNQVNAEVGLRKKQAWGVSITGAVGEEGFSTGVKGFHMITKDVGVTGYVSYDSMPSRYGQGPGISAGTGLIVKI